MIITKKAMPRRTFLKGAGTVMALPLLDAMIPAATAWAQTPAKPVPRLGFVYMPDGVRPLAVDAVRRRQADPAVADIAIRSSR